MVLGLQYSPFLDPQSQGQAQETWQLGNALIRLQRSCILEVEVAQTWSIFLAPLCFGGMMTRMQWI